MSNDTSYIELWNRIIGPIGCESIDELSQEEYEELYQRSESEFAAFFKSKSEEELKDEASVQKCIGEFLSTESGVRLFLFYAQTLMT